jgi:replicative DNA helicase Mcm
MDEKVTGLKRENPPGHCLPSDEGGCNRSTTFIAQRTFGVDEQWLETTELPEEMRGARPKTLRVRLRGEDHTDVVEPGDYVWFRGKLRRWDEQHRDGSISVSPEVYVDCENFEILNRVDMKITEEEKAKIKEIAAGPDPLFNAIVPSMAPRIVGMNDVKAGLACILVGGVDSEGAGLRGRSHGLLVGDPGTAKTKLQKFCNRITSKSQYTTIPGATDIGLTAALVRDPADGRFKLEAGVLPLAHGSVAFIDECGQATEKHWKAIEECMELGTVTRSGGGEHGRLRALTSVVCAGNPKNGMRWEEHKSIQEQLGIPDSTLDRFDLVFLIPDDPENDEKIREHIDKHHGHGDPPDDPPMDEKLLSKYIAYAQRIRPEPNDEAIEVIHEAHKNIRAIEGANFGIRAYEGYYRLGEAIARMSLSRTITKEHAEQAVRIHHAGWELLIKQQMEEREPDQKDKHQRAWNVLDKLDVGDSKEGIKFAVWAEEFGGPLDKFQKIVQRLQDDGRVIEIRTGVWKVVR